MYPVSQDEGMSHQEFLEHCVRAGERDQGMVIHAHHGAREELTAKTVWLISCAVSMLWPDWHHAIKEEEYDKAHPPEEQVPRRSRFWRRR